MEEVGPSSGQEVQRALERPSDEQIAAWYPRLFRTALRMSGTCEDASDLTQEAFFRAFRSWGRFDGRSRSISWLHGILVNCVRDWARRKLVRVTEALPEWDLPDGAARPDSGADLLDHEEQLRCLREAIGDLDERLRSPFVAAVLDGYTYDEIAEMLCVPVGTVAHRVYQARQQLGRRMRQIFQDA